MCINLSFLIPQTNTYWVPNMWQAQAKHTVLNKTEACVPEAYGLAKMTNTNIKYIIRNCGKKSDSIPGGSIEGTPNLNGEKVKRGIRRRAEKMTFVLDLHNE